MKKLLSLFAVLLILLSSLSGCAKTPAAQDVNPQVSPETEAPPEVKKSDLAVIQTDQPNANVYPFSDFAYVSFFNQLGAKRGQGWYTLGFDTMTMSQLEELAVTVQNPIPFCNDGQYFYGFSDNFYFYFEDDNNSAAAYAFRSDADGKNRIALAMPDGLTEILPTRIILNRSDGSLIVLITDRTEDSPIPTKTAVVAMNFERSTVTTLFEIAHNVNKYPKAEMPQEYFQVAGVAENNLVICHSVLRDGLGDDFVMDVPVTSLYEQTHLTFCIDNDAAELVPYEHEWNTFAAINETFTDPYTDLFLQRKTGGYIETFDPATGSTERIEFDDFESRELASNTDQAYFYPGVPVASTEDCFILSIGVVNNAEYLNFPIFALIDKADYLRGDFNVREFDYSTLIGKD